MSPVSGRLLVLAALLGCGGGGKQAGDSSSEGFTFPGGNGGGTNDTDEDPWENGAPCPEGAPDDATEFATCPSLENHAWCYTVVGDQLVSFAADGSGAQGCSTQLDRALDVGDMVIFQGIVYACSGGTLQRIDPATGSIEALPRACWGVAAYDGGIVVNENPDIRRYDDEAALRSETSGIRLGSSADGFVDTWNGTLLTLPFGEDEFERSCTVDGTLRSGVPLFDRADIKGVSILGPARMFVLNGESVYLHDADTGSTMSGRYDAPDGADGLACAPL